MAITPSKSDDALSIAHAAPAVAAAARNRQQQSAGAASGLPRRAQEQCAATRDPRAYAEPDRFDIRRTPQVALYLGHGIHSCLGAAFARIESRVAFEEIARRWPRYEVDESGLRRVQMSNVAGYSNVPVTVG